MVSLVRSLRPAVAMLAAALLAGCSGSAPGDPDTAPPLASGTTATAATEPSTTEPQSAAPSATPSPGDSESSSPTDGALALKVVDSPLGEILVDGNGMTLYLFTQDTQGEDASVCEGQCLVNWPPLLGVPTEGEGVDDSKLGSFTRSDGSVQASYNGWPLYYWVQDTAPGQSTGQGVQGVWYVLDRDGDAVTG